ncbi:P-loop NTPase fold protein [Pedobacter sp.]|uniref:P-loop NTPase fold protein n=1 Tax=Pedobacter sp. TaxID=1411316 RepID=UPI00396CAE0D
MNADHIHEIFENYIKTPDTQYALLINGAWGSGKTHFLKENLFPLIRSNELKPIYISLNGISKIENLEYQMLLGLIPYLSNENKAINSFTKVFGNAANAVTKFFTRTSISDVFKGIAIDHISYKDKVICFDDLERCQIPIVEVLGFINNLVEHKSSKVLFLADENRLESDSYNKSKEKVIRHTLTFEPSLAEVFPALAAKYKNINGYYYDFLISEQNTFISFFEEYKENNFRNISFILDCLERAFPHISNTAREYQIETVLLMVILTIELKNGRLTSSDYKDKKDLDKINHSFDILLKDKIFKNKKEKKETLELTYAETVVNFYLQGTRLGQYYFYDAIYVFVLSGYLDAGHFDRELEQRRQKAVPKEVLDFQMVVNHQFRRLPQELFNELSHKVWKNAVKGIYNIYDYVHLANFYYFFAKYSLIELSQKDVKKGLLAGLEIASQRREFDDYQMSNHLAFESEELVQEFKMEVSKVHLKIKVSNYKTLSDQIISALVTNNENSFNRIIAQLKKQLDIQPFAAIDKHKFADAILGASNNLLYEFRMFLPKRYHVTDVHEYLSNEKECFEHLKNEIKKYLSNPDQHQQTKNLLLKELLIEVNKTLNSLENKRMATPR